MGIVLLIVGALLGIGCWKACSYVSDHVDVSWSE